MLSPPAPTGARVLIVDDDAGVRNVCTTLLRALGYRTDAASNGPSALASLYSSSLARAGTAPLDGNDQNVQLVLLDLELPGMHGGEVLRHVKATLPGVRVLVMSGKPGRDLRGFLSAGADGVLRKPFGMNALDDSVGAALRN